MVTFDFVLASVVFWFAGCLFGCCVFSFVFNWFMIIYLCVCGCWIHLCFVVGCYALSLRCYCFRLFSCVCCVCWYLFCVFVCLVCVFCGLVCGLCLFELVLCVLVICFWVCVNFGISDFDLW